MASFFAANRTFACLASATSPKSSKIPWHRTEHLKFPATTWAFTFVAFTERGERGRLRQRHDCLECQRRTMSIVSVCEPSNRMAKDFNCRFRNVLVIVSSARLSQILEQQEPTTSTDIPADILAAIEIRTRTASWKRPGCGRCVHADECLV